MKRTHAGAVCEELQPMGRTHIGEVWDRLMGRTQRWEDHEEERAAEMKNCELTTAFIPYPPVPLRGRS